jgi:chromosomal replication initiator protein
MTELIDMNRDPQELWARCLLNIERRVQADSFDNWFRPTHVKEFSAERLEIEVPTSFFAEWLDRYFLRLIEKVVKEEIGYNPNISFVIAETNPEEKQEAENQTQADTEDSKQKYTTEVEKQENSAEELPTLLTPLNSRYTFDTFVIGDANRFAHAAATAVSKSPGKTQFNPLVFYGGAGLGKTHLLQAIGRYALERKTATKISYVPSERFVSDFIQAIRDDKRPEFQQLYRNADILLMDDIQFLPKTEATQNEFFHTFNSFYQNGSQIVLTCDSPPGELKGVEERLISRFQWGLVTAIEPPDLETRIAILHQKAEISGIHLPSDVAVFLGNHISSNIRELEGALNHMMAYCAMNQEELSIGSARKIVQQRVPAKTSSLSIEAIQQTVADHFGLSAELLVGKTRKQEISNARQIAMYLAKKLTTSPLKVIGLHFGNRDHSTVIHAVQTIEKKCKQDTGFSQLVDTIRNLVEDRYDVS